MTRFRSSALVGSPFRFMVLLAIIAPVALAEPDPVRIGASLSLTGKLAYTGVSQQHGLELAIRDLNARGGIAGRQLELIAEDNGGEPKQAVIGVKKLVSSDRVSLLFTAFSHITQAIEKTANDAGVTVIYAAAIGQPATRNRNFFRDWADAESQGAALVRFMAARGKTKPAYFGEESEGCETMLNGARAELARTGTAFLTEESYAPGTTDFRSLLLRIRSRAPDGILCCTWRDEAVFMPQVKTSGLINTPTFHILAPLVKGGDTPEMRALFAENGAVSIWVGFVEGEQTPAQLVFSKRFKEAFGDEPSMEAVLAYDDLIAYGQSSATCSTEGRIDAECVSAGLREFRGEGIAGQLAFDEHRLSTRKDVFLAVRDGRWVRAK